MSSAGFETSRRYGIVALTPPRDNLTKISWGGAFKPPAAATTSSSLLPPGDSGILVLLVTASPVTVTALASVLRTITSACGCSAFSANRASIVCCTSSGERPAAGTRPAYGTLIAPDVNAHAIEALDLVGKTAGGPWRGGIEITGRGFGVAGARAPELGDDAALAVLASEI